MLKPSTDQRREWFRCVNQKLGEASVVRMTWDRLKISKTAKRAEQKFPIAKRAMR
jgi:hypothetical protein